MTALQEIPDVWHVGELHGDRGFVIRDANGLQVSRLATRKAVRRAVRRNNRRELRRLIEVEAA